MTPNHDIGTELTFELKLLSSIKAPHRITTDNLDHAHPTWADLDHGRLGECDTDYS